MIYIYTLMWYWQYLLSVIYITTCTGFVLGWRLSTERVVAQPLHYIFCPPRYKSVGVYQVYCYLMLIYVKLWSSTLCSLIWNYQDCIYTFEICNSCSNMYVNFKYKRVMYCLSFESLCKAMCADHLLGRCLCN